MGGKQFITRLSVSVSSGRGKIGAGCRRTERGH